MIAAQATLGAAAILLLGTILSLMVSRRTSKELIQQQMTEFMATQAAAGAAAGSLERQENLTEARNLREERLRDKEKIAKDLQEAAEDRAALTAQLAELQDKQRGIDKDRELYKEGLAAQLRGHTAEMTRLRAVHKKELLKMTAEIARLESRVKELENGHGKKEINP